MKFPSLRPELLALLAAVAYLAVRIAGVLPGGETGGEPAGEGSFAPPAALALAELDLDTRPDALGRDPFEPPREFLPPPPLRLDAPPLPPPSLLALPPGPKPPPAAWEVYRLELPPPRVPEEGVASDRGAAKAPGEGIAAAGSAAAAEATGEASVAAVSPGEDEPAEDPAAAGGGPAAEDPRDRFDWVVPTGGRVRYGWIRNDDPLGLIERPDEAILLDQVDPRTGHVLARGDTIHRAAVDSFGLARTIENEFLRRERELRRGSWALRRWMDLADWILAQRDDEPRAAGWAETLYREVLVHEPLAIEAHVGIVAVAHARGNLDAEVARAREAVEATARSPRALELLAGAAARLGMDEESQRLDAEALERDPTRYEAAIRLTRWRLARGDAPAALDAGVRAVRAIERTPGAPAADRLRALLARGEARLANGRLEDALQDAAAAAAIDPGDGGALRLQIAVAMAQGFDRKAQALCEKAVPAAGSGSAGDAARDGLLALGGYATLRDGDPRAADPWFDEVVDRSPEDPVEGFLGMGIAREMRGDVDGALELYERARQADPTSPRVAYQLGRLLERLGDPDRAEALLREALRKLPGLGDALLACGRVALARGEETLAASFFAAALDAGVPPARVEAHRGHAAYVSGRLEDARVAYQDAVAADPSDPTALAGVGYTLYALGREEESLSFLSGAVEHLGDREGPEAEAIRETLDRVLDHRTRVEWRDDFERDRLGRGWSVTETQGLEVGLEDGALRVAGMESAQGGGIAGAGRILEGREILAVEVTLRRAGEDRSRAGVAVELVKGSRGKEKVLHGFRLERAPGGGLAVARVERGQVAAREAVGATEAGGVSSEATGEASIVLRLEPHKDEEGRVDLRVGGRRLPSPLSWPAFGRHRGSVRVTLFAEGEPGKVVDVRFEDVRLELREGAR